MMAVAVVTTPFFVVVIIAVRRGLLMTQVARLASRLAAQAARWLGDSSGYAES